MFKSTAIRSPFSALGLSDALVNAVKLTGYTTPTPVQLRAIPAVLQNRDLMVAAQTGTGKTGGFALPILEILFPAGQVPADRRLRPKQPRVLVLTPTRELAAQVHDSFRSYAVDLPLLSACIFGGVGEAPQIAALRGGLDVLVACPGRLLDLVGQAHADLSQVNILVLDEADRMLDMGFVHDVKKVLARLPPRRQNLLFSATFSADIMGLAGQLLQNPERIEVTPPNSTVERIAQFVYHLLSASHKKALLAHLIEQGNWEQVLVFTRTKHGANKLAEYLSKRGLTAVPIHGNKSQTARTKALADFKAGNVRILVATDIAARGLDIEELPHVVNFELPNVEEDYVHRIGRTGRAGRNGSAISLVAPDEEQFLRDIERFTKQRIPEGDLMGFDMSTVGAAEAPTDAREAKTFERSVLKGSMRNDRPPQSRGQGQGQRQPQQQQQRQAVAAPQFAQVSTAGMPMLPPRSAPAHAAVQPFPPAPPAVAASLSGQKRPLSDGGQQQPPAQAGGGDSNKQGNNRRRHPKPQPRAQSPPQQQPAKKAPSAMPGQFVNGGFVETTQAVPPQLQWERAPQPQAPRPPRPAQGQQQQQNRSKPQQQVQQPRSNTAPAGGGGGRPASQQGQPQGQGQQGQPKPQKKRQQAHMTNAAPGARTVQVTREL